MSFWLVLLFIMHTFVDTKFIAQLEYHLGVTAAFHNLSKCLSGFLVNKLSKITATCVLWSIPYVSLIDAYHQCNYLDPVVLRSSSCLLLSSNLMCLMAS